MPRKRGRRPRSLIFWRRHSRQSRRITVLHHRSHTTRSHRARRRALSCAAASHCCSSAGCQSNCRARSHRPRAADARRPDLRAGGLHRSSTSSWCASTARRTRRCDGNWRGTCDDRTIDQPQPMPAPQPSAATEPRRIRITANAADGQPNSRTPRKSKCRKFRRSRRACNDPTPSHRIRSDTRRSDPRVWRRRRRASARGRSR